MPSREQLRTYAEVAIMVGLGLEPDDRVLIEIPTALPDLAHDLVDVAYEGGAEDVEVLWLDTEVERSRFTSGGSAAAETVSGRSRLLERAFGDGVSYLRVLAQDPAAMAGIDPGLIGRFTKVNSEVVFAAREQQFASEEPWTVIAAPVADWTGSVFPDVALEEATERLWSAIFRTCRVDQPDPVAAWNTHLDDLVARRRYLTDRRFVALRYQGTGTDLEVGLPDRAVWQGGGETTSAGRRFCPNIPTEEVYVSPHLSKANGRIAATKPLSYFGSVITGFWLKLSEGEVVDSGAESGDEVLTQILGTDEGSRRLGEAAMVPQSGAVASEDLVWNNMLYDENDACHIALGQSFPTCLEGGTALSIEERKVAGLNQSAIHVDFVVGSPQVNVAGVTSDGTEEPIIANGEWGFTP
jgi:aminopeptidase